MKERKRHITDTEKLQIEVDREYQLDESLRDAAKLANLETQLSFARNSIADHTNEYTKLLNEQQKISKDLKATREQRIKRIEDGKSSWIGLIRMLEDEEIREKKDENGNNLNVCKKNTKKLSEYHTYQDGTADTSLNPRNRTGQRIMKTAIITGVNGQDGSYLSEFLLDKNYTVVGCHRRNSTNNFHR